jgi:hypothetical protein
VITGVAYGERAERTSRGNVDIALPTLIFEFETSKAHVIDVEDQILLTVVRNGVRLMANLPPREALGYPGPNQPYRIRVPLASPINQAVVNRIAAGVPNGVRVRLEP